MKRILIIWTHNPNPNHSSMTEKALTDNIQDKKKTSQKHLKAVQPEKLDHNELRKKDLKNGSKEPAQTIMIRNYRTGPQRRDVLVNRLPFDKMKKESRGRLTFLNPLNTRA